MSASPDKPCKYGHVSPRRKNGNCIECEKLRGKTPKKLEAAKKSAASYRERLKTDPELKEAHAQYMREYSKKNREVLNKGANAWYAINKIRVRLQRKKIPVTDELVSYIENHDNKCDICGNPPDGKWTELSYDHCHTSGVFRGLLCSSCNRALGFFKDDTSVMERAIAYLKHYQE